MGASTLIGIRSQKANMLQLMHWELGVANVRKYGIGLLALRTDTLFTPAPKRDRSFYLSSSKEIWTLHSFIFCVHFQGFGSKKLVVHKDPLMDLTFKFEIELTLGSSLKIGFLMHISVSQYCQDLARKWRHGSGTLSFHTLDLDPGVKSLDPIFFLSQ